MLTLDPVNSLFGLLTKVYTASVSIGQVKSGGPNLYIGIPMLVLALVYFACSAIPLRKRMSSLIFAAVFIVSFLLMAPYVVWHAFNLPNFFPARFSFLFSFLLIELAWQGYRALQQSSVRELSVGTAVVAAGFFALTAMLLYQMRYIEYLALKTVILDVVFFCATCFLVLWLCKARRLRTATLLVICGMQAVCLLLNSYYPIVRLNKIWSITAVDYTEKTQRGKALVERIQDADDGLYRMEFNYHRCDTDPMAYDYFGLTHFSPDADAAAIEFAAKLGFRQTYYHLRYASGTTPVLESLFGVKYILQKDGIAFEALPEGYELLWRDGNVETYINTYALPFAYLVPKEETALSDDHPFINQNILLADLTGDTVAVFEPIFDIGRTYDGTWETYTFSVKANRQLYLKSFGSDYIFNGKAYSGERMNGSILLPAADTDVIYEVKMTTPLGIHLAYFDFDAFMDAQAILASHAVVVASPTDSRMVIHAEVTDAHTQLLITVPYDKGWRVWIDGERAETAARYNALLAVDLTQGKHIVELRFIPKGLLMGTAISLISLVIIVLWIISYRKRA